jgi:hypothetical protein
MESCIKELKEFAKWFKTQVDADANDLLTDRHSVKLNSILQKIETSYSEMAEQKKKIVADKAYIVSGLSLLERIAIAIEKEHVEKELSFWKRFIKWLCPS